jgi:DNA-binding SARP family transcriptional activator/DNA-binding XRE family transcriptional regulator
VTEPDRPHVIAVGVRILRQRAALTQAQLARRSGVSIRAVRDIERGLVLSPRAASMDRLAAGLGMTAAELFEALRSVSGAGPSVAILGPLELTRHGRPVGIRSTLLRSLLGLLALRVNELVSPDEIIAVLWGQDPPRTVLTQVRTAIGRLRALCEPEHRPPGDGYVVRSSRGEYQLCVDADRVDAHRFKRLAADALRARAEGAHTAAVPLLGQALDCWRGPVLVDASDRLHAHPAAVELSRHRLEVALAYADAAAATGRDTAAIDRLRALTSAEPLNEALHARLVLALVHVGERATALQLHGEIRARLADELGVEPGPELRAVYGRVSSAEHADDETVPVGPPDTPGTVQLPPDVDGFVARADALARLDALVPAHPEVTRPAAAALAVLSGVAGVGKTALAVHWAHGAQRRFSDGALYVNLRGFDAGPPMALTDAVRGFLEALGLPTHRIPSDVDAQVGLYRSAMAHRRMLILLDNARDAEQVRPLLPASPGCMVVATSRSQLTDLVAAEGACPITLDLLSHEEARDLLARRIGADRTAAQPDAVHEIVGACTGLPLALVVCAMRAASYPHNALDRVAADLREARGGLDPFDAGENTSNVRAVFSWSYRTLSPVGARLFRLLALHPGPDTAAPAAASLLGRPLAEVRPVLAELTRAHLLTEHAPGRHGWHDLLRDYATERLRAEEPTADRSAALHRLLDHYCQSASTNADLLDPQRGPIVGTPARPGVTVVTASGGEQALTWFRIEHAALVSLPDLAAHAGLDRHVVDLAIALCDYLDNTGRWRDWVRLECLAVEAARRLGDAGEQARAHRHLGRAYSSLGDYLEAERHYQEAIARYDDLGDPVGQAGTQFGLSWLLELQGRIGDSLVCAQRSLELYESAGHLVGQARALNNVGWTYGVLGQYEKTIAYCERALALQEEIGDTNGQASTLDSMGYAHHHLGHLDEAIGHYRRALAAYRACGDRYNEADVLVHIGDTRHAAGELGAATDAWRAAYDILTELDQPDTTGVAARLSTGSPDS